MPRINLLPNEYILRKHPDITWRKWLEMVWNDIEWPVIALLGLTSLTLGVIGYSHYPSQDTQNSFWNNLYQSLQLFSIQASFESSPIPPTLQIARFLSPALAIYALFQAFMVVFKEQLELFRLVRMTNHAIVCGLGQKGLHLVKDLRKAHRPVVVIERDGNNPNLEACRELGAIVVIGDARDPRMLLKAGVLRARNLIAVCNEDGTNVEVTEQAQVLVEGRRRSVLTCTAHIVDTYLWTLLREKEFAQEQSSFFRFEMFNIYDSGARTLRRDTFNLSDYNVSDLIVNDTKEPPPHLLIIGMGTLAEHFIIHAAQEWRLKGWDKSGKLLISVVDANDVEYALETLQIHYPFLGKTCEFHIHKYHTNYPDFQTGKFLEVNNKFYPITHAYICFDDTPIGLLAGFTLLRLLPDRKIQIMVRMTEDAGLEVFLKKVRSKELSELEAFGLLDATCKIGLLDDGTHEALARIIHDNYFKNEKARFEQEKGKDETAKANPNMVPWDELPEEVKESNRRQADHIGLTLGKAGLGLKPWREYEAEKFPFNPKELDVMAREEHKRWCEDKKLAGWKYGEKRDDDRKIHPDLMEMWDDPRLTEDAREKDRAAVKLIPQLLAQAGFQIYRIGKWTPNSNN